MDVDVDPFAPRKGPKERVHKLNTVSVRNLSANTTTKIQDLFGNLAPIKRCFAVIKDGKCSGVGFVQYATEDDAKKAAASLNHTKLNGKSIEVVIARPRSRTGALKDDKDEPEAPVRKARPSHDTEGYGKGDTEPGFSVDKRQAKAPKAAQVAAKVAPEEGEKDERSIAIDVTKTALASRTVVINDISEDVVFKQLVRKIKKFGRIEALQYPVVEGLGSAYVLYHGADQAAAALLKLKDFTIGTKPVSIQMFSTMRTNRFRVIVRNLPFVATEADLRKAFEQYGAILQIDLPEGSKPGLNRGFGFVTYTNGAAANKAVIEGAKLKIKGRLVAPDLTVSRQEVATKNSSTSASDKTSKTGKTNGNEMDVDENDSDSDASDGASSGASEDDDDKDGSISGSDESASEAESDEEESKKKNYDSEEEPEFDPDDPESYPQYEPEFESESEEDEEDGKEKTEEKEKKRELSSDVHLGQTLFLRNVAFDTTEEDLANKFSEWGTLKHAKVVVDKATGEAKGTAFVHFEKAEDAQKCLDDAYRSQKFKLQKRKVKGREEPQSKESDISVGGRHLIIDVAVARKTADQLAESNKTDRERKKDKRNLYLAAYGTLPNAQLSELTKEERDKYDRGQHEKTTKLANPNFHVSRTRLVIRNLPKTMDEAALKTIFKKAVANVPGRMGFHQVKVVRDKERGDTSRGFGFVEFSDHAHALAALESLHNKPQSLTNQRRFFVEFAIEDSRVLQAREFRLNKAQDIAKSERRERTPRRPRSDSVQSDQQQQNPKKRKRDDNNDKNGAKQQNGRRGPKPNKRGGEPPAKRAKITDSSIPQGYGRSSQGQRVVEQALKKGGQGFQSDKPIRKGSFNTPAAGSRRDKQNVREKHSEQALEKMIGQYKKTLDGPTSKKRWFQD